MMMVMMPDDELLTTCNPNKQATSQLWDLNTQTPPNDACWALTEWWLSEEYRNTCGGGGGGCPTAAFSTTIMDGFPEHRPLNYKIRCHSSGRRQFSMPKYCGGQTSFLQTERSCAVFRRSSDVLRGCLPAHIRRLRMDTKCTVNANIRI